MSDLCSDMASPYVEREQFDEDKKIDFYVVKHVGRIHDHWNECKEHLEKLLRDDYEEVNEIIEEFIKLMDGKF